MNVHLSGVQNSELLRSQHSHLVIALRVLSCALNAPLLIDLGVHGHVAHRKRSQEPYREYAHHNFPYNRDALAKSTAYIVLQGLRQSRDDGNGCIREIDTGSKLGEKFDRKFV